MRWPVPHLLLLWTVKVQVETIYLQMKNAEGRTACGREDCQSNFDQPYLEDGEAGPDLQGRYSKQITE